MSQPGVNEAGRLWTLHGRKKKSCYETTCNLIKFALLMSMDYIGMAFLEQLLLFKINAFIGHMCKCLGDYKMNLVVTGTDIKPQLLKGITANAQK
jgi:hypothetical protein